MSRFKIPVVYTMLGTVEVEAENLDEAIQKAIEGSLPEDAEYLSDSMTTDENSFPEVLVEDDTWEKFDWDEII